MRDERGLSESVQWAVLTPVVLLMVLGVIQAGILLHGRSVAANAALGGAESAALSGAGGGQGDRVARDIAVRGGLLDVDVAVSTGDGRVLVDVRGRTDSFLDLGLNRVSAHAEQPVEAPR